MDRQIRAEKAWLIPQEMRERLNGDFSIGKLAPLRVEKITRLMSKPYPLHRYLDIMSGVFFSGVRRIVQQYGGDASRIWEGTPSSAEVVYRFLEFDGAGPKIASMAANILAREFKVPFSDYYSINISADVHVIRVFERLGLTGPNPSPAQVIFKARALYPEFPGLMDLPCWEIGRQYCRPSDPNCGECIMNRHCKTAQFGLE